MSSQLSSKIVKIPKKFESSESCKSVNAENSDVLPSHLDLDYRLKKSF